jgi:hypothetical protein
MVAVGSSVLASDYNAMRTTVSSILNTQYNQTLLSSAVIGDTNSVTSSQILNLFLDLQRTHVHQIGSINSNIAVVASGYTIGADVSQNYNQSTGVKTSVTDGTKMGFNDLNSVAVTISNFDGSVSGWPAGNFTLGTPLQSSRSSVWGGAGDPVQAIYHVVTVTFSDATNMNSFFAAGGEIRFSASLTSPGNSKSVDWQSMLSAMNAIRFNKYRITASSGTPNPSGSGFDSLTSSYRTLYTKVGSGVYTDNEYTIEGRLSAANTLRFRITLNDGDVGTDLISPDDESVIGTVTSSVNTFHPDSSFVYNAVTYTAVSIAAPTIATAESLMTNFGSPPA